MGEVSSLQAMTEGVSFRGVVKGGPPGPPLELNYIIISPSHAGKLSPFGNVSAWEGAGGGAQIAHPQPGGRRDGGGTVGTAGQYNPSELGKPAIKSRRAKPRGIFLPRAGTRPGGRSPKEFSRPVRLWAGP